jgi:D-sedoheptulose 7-phosphate isomerase
MTVTDYLTGLADMHGAVVASGFADEPMSMPEAMARCLRYVEKAKDAGGVVHLVGNGGSAAIVAHAHNDLLKAAGMRALVHQDIPALTAFANDEGYAKSSAGPLATWMRPIDVLVVVSSSGMSANILAAIRVAVDCGAKVITCSGFEPTNRVRPLGHVNFYVPSAHYGYVELTHAALLHYLTDVLAHA